MTDTPPPEFDPEDLCEDEEVFACGDGGTEEDQEFDEIIGVIEDFMISFNPVDMFKDLPSLATVESDHERHNHHKKLVDTIEERLDTHIAEMLPGKHMADIAAMIEGRMAEVSEEVWEFVSHGCMDYVSFLALWKEKQP